MIDLDNVDFVSNVTMKKPSPNRDGYCKSHFAGIVSATVTQRTLFLYF